MSTPFVMVIFGATGDLAQNKLFPALFSLYKKKQIGPTFYIVGFARRPLSDVEFRETVKTALFPNEDLHPDWEEFSKNLFYQNGMFGEVKGYSELINTLNDFDQKHGACITRLFYLATPPDNYSTILDFLQETKLSEGCGQGSTKWTKLIIEKPFGKDVATAKALDEKLSLIFEEKQIFRVDHYLGKETVQNVIAFRFANGIFEPVWNSNYIDNVQITLAEDKGVNKRGAFFDGVGILRDIAQNHLMQLMATVTMEQPTSFSREGVRDARAKAIAAVVCIKPEEVTSQVVRGQYEGYLQEKNVQEDSYTETYVAIKLFVNTPRFKGVPFYLRAGKNLARGVVDISIVFKQTCHILFKEYGCPEEGNVLSIRIQPDEGIMLRVVAKKPGNDLALDTVDLKFSYKDQFGDKGVDAYEKILVDVFSGDQMLFNRSDELQSSWELITNILNGWKALEKHPHPYKPGSWGPQEAEELIGKDGRRWIVR